MGSRSRSFRSAATWARRSARCSAAFIVLPRGADQRRVVLRRCAAGHGRAVSRLGHWYKAHGIARLQAEKAVECGAHRRAADARARGDWRSARADLLQVFLHGEPDQLLHAVSDRSVSRIGSAVADPDVRVSGIRGRRNAHRWAARRQVRAQADHLDVNPRACCRSR